MTLQPQLLGGSSPSIVRLMAATAAATTAVFTIGVLTGAGLMRTPTAAPRAGCEPPSSPAMPSPPLAAPVVAIATVPAVPALPDLGWTATGSHGAVNPSLQWAATLYELSSQYTATSWSAAQVLGAPDVYPRSGDDAAAWASLSADGGREQLEVGFDRPARLDAVHLFETYNPGAIGRLEGVAADGRTVILFDRTLGQVGQRDVARAPEHGSAIRVVSGACTPFPIARLRITLDSHLTPGWNELDAIGVHACPR